MKKIFLLLIVFYMTIITNNTAAASDYLQSLETHKALIEKAENAVSENTRPASVWTQVYHFMPDSGWNGVFSGLAYFNGGYNIFYAFNPFIQSPSVQYAGHSFSGDLLRWARMPVALAASDFYDSDGIGSVAVAERGNLLYVLYPGFNKIQTLAQKTINAAVSNDGVNFIKHADNPVIKPPKGDFSEKRFDYPYLWKHDDIFYLLIASSNKAETESKLLLYKSKNLLNWELFNVIEDSENESKIWEYPAYIEMKGMNGILLSYKEKDKKSHEVLYKTGIIPGNIDYTNGKFVQKGNFQLLDYGFDYYAPQVQKADGGKYIVFGYLKEYKNNHSSDYISGALPRIISCKNNKLYSEPVPQTASLRESRLSFKNFNISYPYVLKGFSGDVYEIDTLIDMKTAKNFSLKLRTSDSEETVLFYDKVKQLFILNREKSGVIISGAKGVKVPLRNHCIKLHIFVDKSSVEVFINDGEAALSSRIYPSEKSYGIKMSAFGRAKVKYFNFYKLNVVQ